MGKYIPTGKKPGFKEGYVPTPEHREAMRAAARYRAAHGYRAVIARGVRYNNLTQAARALKMSTKCMRNYVVSELPHHHEYYFEPESNPVAR